MESDPRQGSIEAGPSRLPYISGSQQSTSTQTEFNSTGSEPAATVSVPPAHAQVRSIPTIVPTTVDSDGLRRVPHLFELCEVEDLITLIASMLDRLLSHNDRIPLTPTGLTRFHSRAPPSINVRDYLLRIARYTNVEPCCLLILLPYVDKVCARMNTFTISSLTVHRFVIAGVSVGSKALSDSFCTNGRYARVGGVSVAEMNLLEKEFCEAIDWRLTTTGTVLAHYYTSLVTAHPAYKLAEAPTPTAAAAPISTSSLPSSNSNPSVSRSASTNPKTPFTAQKIPLPDVSPDHQQGFGLASDEDEEMTSGSGELSSGTQRRRRGRQQNTGERSDDDEKHDDSEDDIMDNEPYDNEEADESIAGSASASISASASSSSIGGGSRSTSHLGNGHGGSSSSRRSSSNLSLTAAAGPGHYPCSGSPSSRSSPYTTNPSQRRTTTSSTSIRSPGGGRSSTTSSPALIPPPNLNKRVQATASHLPSPIPVPNQVELVPQAQAVVAAAGNSDARVER